MSVMFGAVVDEEKTWAWKCTDLKTCAVLDETGNGTIGCQVSNKRIQCCCQEDYCTSDPWYEEYAKWGRPDHFPPNFTAILEIDHGDIPLVVVDVPGYESNGTKTDEDIDTEQDTDEDTDEEIEENDDPDQETIEECLITDAIASDCSCGSGCASVEYEYKAKASKCGDETLSTG
eukprot:340401_1